MDTLRILGMSWGVKTTCFEGAGVSLGGSGVSIGRIRILRVAVIVPSTVHPFTPLQLLSRWNTPPALESLEHGSFVMFPIYWLFGGWLVVCKS